MAHGVPCLLRSQPLPFKAKFLTMLLPIKCFPALTVEVIDGQENFFFDSEMMNFVDDNRNQNKKKLSLLTLLQLKESKILTIKLFTAVIYGF